METNSPKLEDIIFEGRNKDYGAYHLRKLYNKNMIRAMMIAVFLFLAGVSAPLIASLFRHEAKVNIVDERIVDDLSPIKKDEQIKDLPKLQEKKRPVYSVPRVTIDADPDAGLDDLMDDAQNKPPVDTSGNVFIVDEPDVDKRIIDIPEIETPSTVVEEMPEFPGGEAARIRFLNENIVYPRQAREVGIEGKVFVTFVVEKDGSITGIALLRGIGGGCDEEALKAIKAMPKWKPGRQNGKEVRVQLNLPVNFILH